MKASSHCDRFARAAMLGLLAASPACSGPIDAEFGDRVSDGDGASGGDATAEAGGASSDPNGGEGLATGGNESQAGGGASATGGGTTASGGAGGASGGASQSSGGAETDSSGIEREEVRPGLTLSAFTEECNEVGGAVETHATCGGANSCKGFSYDTDTDVFSVHGCMGKNTCSGFSCVVPE